MLIGAHFMPLLFAALVRPEGGGADDTGFALLFDPDDLSAPEVAEDVPPLQPEQEEDAETPEETASRASPESGLLQRGSGAVRASSVAG